ncbi:hypothetical protein NEHOM01_2294 [Nematocida homosporus]|uniref:uncharacterized protein n=1 Tax=Nematocida homosporus TaxID=1912981 RepID=UPI00221F886F|nr:uncharacterized protein NEHOM01_2294 [Nematocida homosporus]KAI5187590.1 hypothetical protein NEHOM01_2294 [Nematocida homosporus]
MIWVSLVLFVLLGQTVRSFSTSDSDNLFENGKPGYLKSMAANQYLGKVTVLESGRRYYLVGLVKAPPRALQIYIYRQSTHGLPYNLILIKPTATSDGNASALDSNEKQNTMTSRDVFALNLVQFKTKFRYIFSALDTINNNYQFSFSPVIDPINHAFQIYTNGSCLTITNNRLLSLEPCIDSDRPGRTKQLFQWVNAVASSAQ